MILSPSKTESASPPDIDADAFALVGPGRPEGRGKNSCPDRIITPRVLQAPVEGLVVVKPREPQPQEHRALRLVYVVVAVGERFMAEAHRFEGLALVERHDQFAADPQQLAVLHQRRDQCGACGADSQLRQAH